MPYKKSSIVYWDDYSKLFDTSGYYKLIKGKPEEDKCLLSVAEGASVKHMDDKNSISAAGHVANDNFIGYSTPMAMPIESRQSEKQPWLMGVKSTKRDYSSYGNLKVLLLFFRRPTICFERLQLYYI